MPICMAAIAIPHTSRALAERWRPPGPRPARSEAEDQEETMIDVSVSLGQVGLLDQR